MFNVSVMNPSGVVINISEIDITLAVGAFSFF